MRHSIAFAITSALKPESELRRQKWKYLQRDCQNWFRVVRQWRRRRSLSRHCHVLTFTKLTQDAVLSSLPCHVYCTFACSSALCINISIYIWFYACKFMQIGRLHKDMELTSAHKYSSEISLLTSSQVHQFKQMVKTRTHSRQQSTCLYITEESNLSLKLICINSYNVFQ